MPKTVLAVADDTQTLQAIRGALQHRYKVWTFRDPYKALASVQEGIKPQLVLCGYQLFGMTGSEFRSQLRGRPRLGEAPFVFLLSLSERNRAESLRAQGDHFLFLQLPLSKLELIALVDRYLALPERF